MAGNIFDAQSPFNCPVCLDLFKDPVTTSCGHSFCKDCISRSWDEEYLSGVYSCPTCRQTFFQRPTLNRSTVLAELVEERRNVQQICSQHNMTLDFYCHNDQKCICEMCLLIEHIGHETAPAANEMALTKEEIKIKKDDFIEKTKDIEKTVKEFENALKVHKDSAQAAVEHIDRVFRELIRSIKRKQTEVRKEIRDQERKETTQVQDHIEKLNEERRNLQEEKEKLELLLQTQDHIYFFKNYLSASGLYIYKTLPRTVNNLVSFEKVEKSVSALKRKLDEDCKEHMARISTKVANVQLFKNTRLNFPVYLSSTSENDSTSSESDAEWSVAFGEGNSSSGNSTSGSLTSSALTIGSLTSRASNNSGLTSAGLTSDAFNMGGLTSGRLNSGSLTSAGLNSGGFSFGRLTSAGLNSGGLTSPGLSSGGLTSAGLNKSGFSFGRLTSESSNSDGLTTAGLNSGGLTFI